MNKTINDLTLFSLSLAVTFLFALSACARLPIGTPSEEPEDINEVTVTEIEQATAPPEPIEVAEIAFRVTVPEDTPSDGPIRLTILDEVTGLALNAIHYELQAETTNTYAAMIQLPANAIIKYRYTRGSDIPATEHTTDGKQVRYRLVQTNASGEIHDIIARWNDTTYAGPITGRLNGTIIDSESGEPIPNLMITAGGFQTLTRWDGSFLIEGLPPGTHNMVAYAMDGSFQTFQQGAVIASEASTPANFSLSAASLTTVTFYLNVPEDTIPAVPIRIAGNIHQLGNTFANLSGGISTPASRLPELSYNPDGFYLLSIDLPAGAYIRYKYTLGDGFWNMETDKDGNPRMREFIVPEENAVITDLVFSWQSPSEFQSIWIAATTPPTTPADDTIWLQLNPWGWTEPLPMWRTGPNSWVFLLSSPLHYLGDVSFRFCRNAQCDKALEIDPTTNRTFRPTDTFQPFDEVIGGWSGLTESSADAPSPTADIVQRSTDFITGITLQEDYTPGLTHTSSGIFANIKSLQANTVFLQPTWTYARITPPIMEPIKGQNLTWLEIIGIANNAQTAGLNIALYPSPIFADGMDQWWQDAPRDYGWWINWFEQYSYFARHHADLARRINASMLILGGEWLDPARPDGFMPDGFTSGVPVESEAWWVALIEQIRALYAGQLVWALRFPEDALKQPSFLGEFDAIYVEWNASLVKDDDRSLNAMVAEAEKLFDNQLIPIYLQFNKPIYIVFDPVSASKDNLDLDYQSRAYEALLRAVNTRDWIAGVISAEYYPSVELRDLSSSIHGKPAEQLLSAWFSAWLP